MGTVTGKWQGQAANPVSIQIELRAVERILSTSSSVRKRVRAFAFSAKR
jgi:hypothetical protein